MKMSENEIMERRQFWHHQVKNSAQGWAKIVGIKEKIFTNEIYSSGIIKAILACVPTALSINRYDVDHNDFDRSIYRFISTGKAIERELNLPISLTFKDKNDPEAKLPYVIIHLITSEVAFISSKSEDCNLEFLTSLLS